MILAIPYHPLITDYKAFSSDLRRRGAMLNHILMTISLQEHEEAAFDFAADIADLFGRRFTTTLPVLERGGLKMSNDFFVSAARFVYRYKSGPNELENPAMLYLDPNYRPTRNNWLDTIQSEYYLRNAPPVFGTFTVDDEEARIFQGPVVISREYAPSSGLLDHIPPTEQWRKYLRWELTKAGVETNLIGTSAESVLKPTIKKKP